MPLWSFKRQKSFLTPVKSNFQMKNTHCHSRFGMNPGLEVISEELETFVDSIASYYWQRNYSAFSRSKASITSNSLPAVEGWPNSSQPGTQPSDMPRMRAGVIYNDILLKADPPVSDKQTLPEGPDEWVLCHRVNLHFYVIKDKALTTCLACQRHLTPTRGQRHTDFLQRVLCPAGHDKHLQDHHGLCNECDTDIILNISKHQQTCFETDCNKFLIVDQPLIEWSLRRVKAQPIILNGYLKLLKQHSVFECIACYETISLDSPLCPTRTPSSTCTHDIDICTTCFQHHLSSSIKPQRFQQVRCPTQNCNQLLTLSDIKHFATPALYQAYSHASFLNRISTDPSFRWCTNPSSTCQSGQLHPPAATSPCWTCTQCAFRNCFVEKIPWHENETCEQHQLSKRFDGLSMTEIKRRTKKCPNRGCGARIMKNGMCKDMTCRSMVGGVGGCGRTFCWECKVLYDVRVAARGDSQHLESCRYRLDRRASVVPRPERGDERYAEGWDADEGYVPEVGESWNPQGS